MRKLDCLLLLLLIIITNSCSNVPPNDFNDFEVYCEMVSSGAKPIALHHPIERAEANQAWDQFLAIAKRYGVELYREDSFPSTSLFSTEMTRGKSVILIYQGNRLVQYKQWKSDIAHVEDHWDSIAYARRFGRLLGYNPQGINRLLSENTNYITLADLDVKQQITHLYYENMSEANEFYLSTLGLKQIDSSVFQISDDAFIQVHPLTLEHPLGQDKSTAIALLTNQLPQWYEYVKSKNVPIKYTYKPKDGGPHDGFVAIDPGGYLLEFEQFKQHPENELFIATLSQAKQIKTSITGLSFFGSITWTYHKDMLKMQQFYEEVLGYQLVADQGWTKIYQTSSTGYIGLVDECRGMENYADNKAIEIEWKISNQEKLELFKQNQIGYPLQGSSIIGPEKYLYQIEAL